MGELWRRKRKREQNDPWSDFFKELKRFEDATEEIVRQAVNASYKRKRVQEPHDLSITTESDEETLSSEYYDMCQKHYDQFPEDQEPLIDVFEEKEEVVIVTNIPGVEKDDIELKVTRGRLIILVKNFKRKYNKELKIPTKIDNRSIRSSYKNGVLEVHLRKKGVKNLRIW